MDTSTDARRTTGTAAPKGGRLLTIALIVIFDIAAPLVAYKVLRSAGLSAVTALVLSGVFPALGVTIGAVRNRRLDVVGALVLAGVVVGTVLGLVTHSARLVLVEGSVPTAVFGVACLGSLWAQRPLLFSVVREFTGPDTAKGREMTRLWHAEPAFRRDFRVITAVWGVGFLVEAALRVVIVYNVSTGTALAISKVMPFVFGGVVSAWTLGYGAYRKKQSIRVAIAAGQRPGPSR
ncbi:MAG TPA: VC0807 family protein [Streptosporangiaceae bacterium]|nr:VC0807 family protein [Streptosporangiaceae bacterium]